MHFCCEKLAYTCDQKLGPERLSGSLGGKDVRRMGMKI